jgi:hypothetical protein
MPDKDCINDVLHVINGLYSELNLDIDSNDDFYQLFENDNLIISMDKKLLYEDVVEIIMHEAAHVLSKTSDENDHNEDWERYFNELNETYNDFVTVEYADY